MKTEIILALSTYAGKTFRRWNSFSISNCWTFVYAPLPSNTIQFDAHQAVDLTSLYIQTAITVWTQAFAVPDMLCVKADVTCNAISINKHFKLTIYY